MLRILEMNLFCLRMVELSMKRLKRLIAGRNSKTIADRLLMTFR